jgi:hypothetical protein
MISELTRAEETKENTIRTGEGERGERTGRTRDCGRGGRQRGEDRQRDRGTRERKIVGKRDQ